MSACECAACGRSFTCVTAFDAHQYVSYGRHPAVTCRDPAALGMVPAERGRWRIPADEDATARLARLRTARRPPPAGGRAPGSGGAAAADATAAAASG